MTIDVERHLGAVERLVTEVERDGRPARAVTLMRSYDTDIEDLWDAVTSPERLPRWFLPVEGDLELGGRYQLQGNAGGTITDCEAPSRLGLTWEFAGDVSWVDVHLAPEGAERTRLTLIHTAYPGAHWDQFGPGVVGTGWDLALLGLALHLSDRDNPVDENEFSTSPEGKAFVTGSSTAWGEAAIAGGADAAEARAAAARTTAFYTGESPPDQ